jgi:hypothetical protein
MNLAPKHAHAGVSRARSANSPEPSETDIVRTGLVRAGPTQCNSAELRNIPALRRFDARRYADRFRNDNEPPI